MKHVQYRKAKQQRACLALGETVVGMVRHPYTGCWQVWVSLTGWDLVLVSAHCEQYDAEANRQTLKAVLGSKDYYDANVIAKLFLKLGNASEKEPQPLPQYLVVRIFQAIWHGSQPATRNASVLNR